MAMWNMYDSDMSHQIYLLGYFTFIGLLLSNLLKKRYLIIINDVKISVANHFFFQSLCIQFLSKPTNLNKKPYTLMLN